MASLGHNRDMAKGLRGRDFRPGTARRRFDPRFLVEVLREVGRPDDIDGDESGETYTEVVQTLYVHKRVRSGGEAGTDENPTFAQAVEFVADPRIKIPIPRPDNPAETLGEEPMGVDAFGDSRREGDAFRIEGPQVKPGT